MTTAFEFTQASVQMIIDTLRPTHHIDKFCSHRGFPGEGPSKGDISAISANVRGLNKEFDLLNTTEFRDDHIQPNIGSGSKFHHLVKLFNKSTYNILMIQEHKLKKSEKSKHDAYTNCFSNLSTLISYNDADHGSGGTAILINHAALDIKPEDISWATGLDGRVTTALFEKDDEKHHFASVYGPHEGTERITFFNQLFATDLISRDSYVGGDYNCVSNTRLDTVSSNNSPYPNKGNAELQKGMADLGLTDTLRANLGKKASPVFSRISGTRNSRLDMWFTPHHSRSRFNSEIDIHFLPPFFSNHFGVNLTIRNLKKRDWGPGYNRINKSVLLIPTTIDAIDELISKAKAAITDPSTPTQMVLQLWETLKSDLGCTLEAASEDLKAEKLSINKAMAEWNQAIADHTATLMETLPSSAAILKRDALLTDLAYKLSTSTSKNNEAMAQVVRELQTAGSKRFFSTNGFGSKSPTFIDKLKPVDDWHITNANNDPSFKEPTKTNIVEIIRNYYEFLYEDKPSDKRSAKPSSNN